MSASKIAARKPTPVKRGKRLLGHIHTADDGSKLYLARRKIADMYRQDEKSLSGAVRAGKAAWGFDEDTLFKMRAEGIERIGVEVKETGEVYTIATEMVFMAGAYFTVSRQRGSQRCITLPQFERSPAKIRV